MIPLGAEVSKAVIYYYSPTTQLGGITLYDAAGICLVKVGKTEGVVNGKEYVLNLEPGERLIGAKAHLPELVFKAQYFDF